MIHWGARVEATHLEDHLSFGSLIAARILNPIIIYFFLSVFYALISYAFQTPFGRYYGDSGFVIYWMMCWMGMCALGLATESIITILTPRFIPFFLLLWIIANVSVAFFPIELLPGFYRYGYAMPFYNVSRTVRALIFNTRNQSMSPLSSFSHRRLTLVFSWVELRRAVRMDSRIAHWHRLVPVASL